MKASPQGGTTDRSTPNRLGPAFENQHVNELSGADGTAISQHPLFLDSVYNHRMEGRYDGGWGMSPRHAGKNRTRRAISGVFALAFEPDRCYMFELP